MDRQLLTVEEISYILNVSEQTVRRLIKKGDLTAVIFGKTYRITEESLNEFIKDKSRRRNN